VEAGLSVYLENFATSLGSRVACHSLACSQLSALLMLNCYFVGGGAVEAGLSVYLENFATSLGSREQLAIAEFADALLVIPKTLAVNAAKVRLDIKYHIFYYDC
jgi:chaperonin GroEL (HSP60 family)